MNLITNEVVIKNHLPASLPRLSPVEFDSALFMMTTSEGRVKRDGEYDQLKLIDVKTLQVVWDMHSPPGAYVESLLSAGTPHVSNLHTTLPRVFYRHSYDHLRAVASKGDYVGADEEVRSRIPQAAEMAVSSSSATFSDPRLVESAPWSNRSESGMSQAETNKLVLGLINALLIVMGAVMFPFFFVRKLFVQKQWSLKVFLLLPLLFAVPYLVLQLPLEVGGDFQVSNKNWIGKLLGSCVMTLPVLGYVIVWVKQLWQRNWKRLLLWTVAPIAIGILLGGMILLGHKPLPSGGRYDWFNIQSTRLIFSGVYCLGLIIVATWVFTSVFGGLNALRKRIFSRPKLATS